MTAPAPDTPAPDTPAPSTHAPSTHAPSTHAPSTHADPPRPVEHAANTSSFVTDVRVRTSDGCSIPVTTRGAIRPEYPSIVLLHGITDSWRSFEAVIDLLPHDVHVVAPTLRGHGDADRPASGYSPDELATDIAGVLVHLGVRSAVVVGHSLGAVVACRLAAGRPDLTAGLVLAGGFADPGRNAALRELVDFTEQLTDPIDRELVVEFQHGTIAQPVPADRMTVFVDESIKVPARVWQAAAIGLVGVDVLDGLRSSMTPTLLVWGTEDPFAPSEEQGRLAEVLGDATILPYPGTGHAVHWEQPDRFAADVMAWWSRCSS
jgi:non-heme chloroperoxidase